MPLKPVLITWEDATHYSGWHNDQSIEDAIETGLVEVETIGWLVDENENFLAVALSASKFRVSDLLLLPRRMITNITYLSDSDKD